MVWVYGFSEVTLRLIPQFSADAGPPLNTGDEFAREPASRLRCEEFKAALSLARPARWRQKSVRLGYRPVGHRTELERNADKIPADTMRALVSGRGRAMCENSRTSSKGRSFSPEASTSCFSVRHTAECSGSIRQHGWSTWSEHIVRVLRETRAVVSKAAHRLGVPRTTTHAVLRKVGITQPGKSSHRHPVVQTPVSSLRVRNGCASTAALGNPLDFCRWFRGPIAALQDRLRFPGHAARLAPFLAQSSPEQ